MFNLTAAEIQKVKAEIDKIQYLNIEDFKDTYADLSEEEVTETFRKVKNAMIAREILLLYINIENTDTDIDFLEYLDLKLTEI
jgi:hypothetical protein